PSLTLAAELLDEATHLARERGEVDVLARAEELRGAISTAPLTEASPPAAGQDADDLAHELVACLRAGETRDASAGAGPPAGE
ncbi:MAG TPA: hypothetical protein VK399_10065, partial [Longimicrobiaceae bacterium]|nr:hypothetical protein [Longimicrobiaceae bacterium]